MKPTFCPFCGKPVNSNYKYINEFTFTCHNCQTFGRIAGWDITFHGHAESHDYTAERLYARRSRDLYLAEYY